MDVVPDPKKWRCYWCGYVTTNEVFLELHLKWHRPEHAWAAAAAAPQPVTANPHPREAIVDGSSLQGQFSGCDAAAAASSRRGTAGAKGRPRKEDSDGRRPGSAQREVVTSSGHAADAPILGTPARSQGKNGKNGKTSPQRGSSGQTRAVAPHSSRHEGKGRTVGKKKRNAWEKQSVKRVNQSVAEGSTHSGSTQAIASFEIGQHVEALDHASRWRVGEVEMVLWGDTSSTESSTADLSAVKVKFTSPGKGTALWYPMRSGRLRQVGQINLTSKRTEVDRLTTSKKSSTQARSNRAQTSKSKRKRQRMTAEEASRTAASADCSTGRPAKQPRGTSKSSSSPPSRGRKARASAATPTPPPALEEAEVIQIQPEQGEESWWWTWKEDGDSDTPERAESSIETAPGSEPASPERAPSATPASPLECAICHGNQSTRESIPCRHLCVCDGRACIDEVLEQGRCPVCGDELWKLSVPVRSTTRTVPPRAPEKSDAAAPGPQGAMPITESTEHPLRDGNGSNGVTVGQPTSTGQSTVSLAQFVPSPLALEAEDAMNDDVASIVVRSVVPNPGMFLLGGVHNGTSMDTPGRYATTIFPPYFQYQTA